MSVVARVTPLQAAHLWVAAGGDRTVAPLAAAIAMAESGGNTQAVGHNTNGTVDVGVWQINSVHGHSEAEMKNPEKNAAVAVELWKGRGKKFTDWVTFNEKTYLKFLGSKSFKNSLDGDKGDFGDGAIKNQFGNAGGVISGKIGDAAAAVSNPLEVLGKIGQYLISPEWWAKIGMYAAGILAIGFGLVLLARDFAR